MAPLSNCLMFVTFNDPVRIELLIEEKRDELFQKLTRKVLPDSFNYSLHDDTPFHSPPDLSEQMITDPFKDDPMESDHNPESPLPPTQQMDVDESSYSVTKSFLTIDKLERIFKVVTGSTEQYYFAFELEGFIVCPTFLAGLFGLTDFACLYVRNDFDFYYIFLEKNSDDPASCFFVDTASFLGDYLFKKPTDKIFLLNFKNKDINCFIQDDDFVRKHPKVGLKERDAFLDSHSTHMMCSDLEPNYWYVPRELKEEFLLNYGTLFTPFEMGKTALVYKDCLSYFEILSYSKPIISEKGKRVVETLENIFKNTKYEREEYILKKLVDHIQDNYQVGKVSKVKSFYASMIAILQSSGYGKSRLVGKLGCKTPTFYSSLQKGNGFPLKTLFLSRFIEELDKVVPKGVPATSGATKGNYCWINNVATAIYIYILRILYIILKNPDNENLDLEGNFDIDDEIEGSPFFRHIKDEGEITKVERIFRILFSDLEDICRYEDNIKFDGTNTLKLGNIGGYLNANAFKFSKHVVCNLEDAVILLLRKLKEKNHVNSLPAIFVIDEAHGLKCKNLKSTKQDFNWNFRDYCDKELCSYLSHSPYNVFRRVFRIYTNGWEEIILIIISTSGQISVLLPDLEDDPSRRPEGSHLYMENFALVHTYCANSHVAPFINAEMFKNEKYIGDGIDGWSDFLKSKFRIAEYFKLGRPLIYGIFRLYGENALINNQYDLEKEFNECREFQFLAEKLFGGRAYTHTTDKALLFCLFNFAFGTFFLPPYIKKEDLVESYLMTLIKCLDEKGCSSVIGGFLPEGIFNFLSARYFIEFPTSLSWVLNSSAKYGLCDIGHFGELLAQIILLKTIFDFIDDRLEKVRKLVFQPVTLENFLLDLSGSVDQVKAFFESNKSLVDSQISCGYFEHPC